MLALKRRGSICYPTKEGIRILDRLDGLLNSAGVSIARHRGQPRQHVTHEGQQRWVCGVVLQLFLDGRHCPLQYHHVGFQIDQRH